MIFCIAAALGLITLVFVDSFETLILPRRVRHSFRLTRLYYFTVWFVWRRAAQMMPSVRWRTSFLSIFGPLSLLGLIVVWATVLIFGFALLHWSIGTVLTSSGAPDSSLGAYLYFSGTTFFTLGYGDVVPTDPIGRTLGVIEAGIGFGFLAMVIGYLPVLYQAFSRREVTISLLDARAGTPPTAAEMLRRQSGPNGMEALTELLQEWELWSADLMESHLSYPALAYFRSQHDNQSWIASLTAIPDVCSLAMVGLEGMCQYQARMTFAIARHALVDLSQVFSAPPANQEKINHLP